MNIKIAKWILWSILGVSAVVIAIFGIIIGIKKIKAKIR